MNAFFLFQTGRMLIVLVCLLAVGNLLAYRRITANPAQKWMVWIGLAGAAVALLAIIALHYWRIPRGLSAQYYANSTWTEDRAIELDRYFEADGIGKRVDRFIDFNPNDFNDRYTFSGKPFTVKWDGWLHVPADGMRVSVHSNFDSWLSIDGALRERRVNSPNALDIGAPEARPYLGKKGWSFDEQAEEYRRRVLLVGVPVLSVEAGVTLGWSRYTGAQGDSLGIDHFGASGPGPQVMEKFGFTAENVVKRALALLK